MSNWLIVLGLAALTLAFRSYAHPFAQRLALLGVPATTFAAALTLTGSVITAGVAALSWLFLPWLELLTTVRQLRLPKEKQLVPMPPPSSHSFPALVDLTDQIQSEGFEFVRDAGWEWDSFRQQFRSFYREEDRAHAMICHNVQGEAAFYHISIASRGVDGTSWVTWNYPFPATMKLPPSLIVNKQRPNRPFFDMYQDHLGFLALHNVETALLLEQDEETIRQAMERDFRSQIEHNIHAGILKPTEDGDVRYSLRGLFFIWTQFLCDLLRAR